MDLSNDLISQFAKLTTGDKDKNKETTVYGTVKIYDGKTCVKLDGSDLLTPVDTTTEVKEGQRVAVLVKNHSAVIMGNTSDPSAGLSTTDGITEDVNYFRTLTANNFTATNATIENLKATKADITDLEATDAKIENLKATKAEIKDLEATNATIKTLEANKANVVDLNATNATINNLKASKADIADLNALDAEINNLSSNFATIQQLNATNANINILDAEVADIQTLVNGNLTSDNISSLNLTSANTTVANAFIKDAMIDSITASKLTAGIIDTNAISIKSTDGSMMITGSVQQFKDENGKVRIQIGKDGVGNFTFILYDESGTGVLIDERGIKSSKAIADGLIVDSKVAEGANISGSKLNIASVISEVNKDNSTTIKSNKIYLDEQEQSLGVAFNALKTQVETIQDVSIDGDLSSVKEQVQSNTTQINVNKSEISTLVSQNEIRKEEIKNLDDEIVEVSTDINSKYTSLQQDLSGFKTTVGETYTTKTEFNGLIVGGRNLLTGTKDYRGWTPSNSSYVTLSGEYNGFVVQVQTGDWSYYHIPFDNTKMKVGESYILSVYLKCDVKSPIVYLTFCNWTTFGGAYTYKITDNATSEWQRFTTTIIIDQYMALNAINYGFRIESEGFDTADMKLYVAGIKFEKGNKATDWTPAPEDVQNEIDDVSNNLTNNYSTTSAMNSAINQKANEITSSVSQTYATKQSVTDVSNNLKNNYSTTSAMNSAINQKANEITSSVSQTYATKTETTNSINSLTTRMQTAESKLTKDSLTTTIGDYYTTASDISSYGYATTSQVTQTKNDLTATFKSVGGYNLIKNSCGYGGLRGWDASAPMGFVYPSYHVSSAGFNAIMYIENTATSERYAFSSRFELKPNTTYTLSGYIWMNNNVRSYDLFILLSATSPVLDTSLHYDGYQLLIGGGNEQTPTYFVRTFTTYGDTISGMIRIDHNGYNSNGDTVNCNVHFTGLCLVEGSVDKPWSPHPSETYSASTMVDANGVKVTHTDAVGYTQMGASGFYLNDGSKNVLSITSSGANFNMPINANLITTGTLDASKVTVKNLDASNIITGYISCDRLKGGTLSAADEINFIGGARIFGNDGELDAGLRVSAAGIFLIGGSTNYLDGNWYLNNGNMEISEGDLTVVGNFTLSSGHAKINGSLYSTDFTTTSSANIGGALTVNSTMKLQYTSLWTPTGTAYRDNLKLGNMLLAYDSTNTSLYVLNTSGEYIPVRASRFQATGDVVCNSVWASTKVYANNVALSSDKRLKTDIRYVNIDPQSIGESGLMSPNVHITTKDMLEFIEAIPFASYRMKNEVEKDIDYTYYGFIAQDLLETKVGSELIEYSEVIVENKTYDDEGRELIDYTTEERLRYSENKFIAFLAGAVQEDIKQRKAADKELMDMLNSIINE